MKKYPLGIAFSGGGAKAAAHCGAIQALNEYGIRADVVSGTSAGSIVGALYAAGVQPIEMCNLFAQLEFKDLLELRIPDGGLFNSTPLLKHIRKIIPYAKIEDLPIPLFVVASNIDKGKVAVFNRGELAPRIVASCSMPIIFYPMVINGAHYVDGGVFQNLPVTAIRDKCEKVIAINLHHAEEEKFKNSLIYYAIRSSYLMFLSNTVEDAAKSDLFLELHTNDYTVFDLGHIKELFQIGYETTVQKLEELCYVRVKPPEKLQFKQSIQKKSGLIQQQLKAHIAKKLKR